MNNFELYGKGVFTTLAVRSGKPLLWDKHWRRLVSNAHRLDLDTTELNEADVLGRLAGALEAAGIVDGRARITLGDTSPSDLWPSGDVAQRLVPEVIAGPMRTVPKEFGLGLSPFPVNSRSPLAGVKSCNYLEQVLSIGEARAGGFDEAVRVNERGHVTGGCMSNLFWVTGGKVFTPSLSTGCLAGTTREHVMESVECEEAEAVPAEIATADAIYMTSAGLGVVRVAAFNGRVLDLEPTPLDAVFIG